MGQASSQRVTKVRGVQYHVFNGGIAPDRERAKIASRTLQTGLLYSRGRNVVYSLGALTNDLTNLHPTNTIVLAVKNDFILGAVKCKRKNDRYAEIEFVQTSAEFTGLCTALVKRAIKELNDDGYACVKIWMYTNNGPAACRCYLRAMFRSTRGRVYMRKNLFGKNRYEIVEIPRSEKAIRAVTNVLCGKGYGYVKENSFGNAVFFVCKKGHKV